MRYRTRIGCNPAVSGVVGLVLWLCTVAAVQAAEVVVKNDTFTTGGVWPIVGDFVPGEQVGARLTATCDGAIVAVQILWLEGTPGHGQSLEEAIHIYNGSTFPTPGSQLAILEGPVMTPGYMNEFRYLDEAQTMPLNIPVTSGQKFYVTLQFANPTDVGNGGPSVVRDKDGCQAGKNVIYAIPHVGPGAWYSSCDLLVLGDFVIRAVINCQGTGACCRLTGCLAMTQAQCQSLSGAYAGNGTTCTGDICTAGACCKPTGECVQNFGFQCLALGGDFQGAGISCSPNPCPPPTGACCFGDICIPDAPEIDCVQTGGVWKGAATVCEPNPCDPCAAISFAPGNVNGDGAVDGRDVQGFVAQYLSPTPGTAAFCASNMCSADQVLNNSDLAAFAACLADPTTCASPSCP